MLQCHPHPGDFSDSSRSFHCCFFMGLQRKQGVPASEGEQFDIRRTVEEFKHNVNMYTLWKPGMEIHVSHVKRRNIPNFVFPSGIRPSRPSNVTWDSRRSSELKVSGPVQDNSCEGKAVSNGVDDGSKRKRVDDNVETNLRSAKCLAAEPPSLGEVHEGSPPVSSCSIKDDNMDTHRLVESRREEPENDIPDSLRNMKNPVEVSFQNSQADGSARCNPLNLAPSAVADTTSSKEVEKLAIEKIMSGPYVAHQASPEELDELENDFEYGNQAKDFRGSMKGSPIESSTANAAVAVPVPSGNGSCSSSGLYSNGTLEELEVLFSNLLTFYIVLGCPYCVLVKNYLCFIYIFTIFFVCG